MKKNTVKIDGCEITFTCNKINPGEITIGGDPAETYRRAEPILIALANLHKDEDQNNL